MDQLALILRQPRARRTDPATSHKAAAAAGQVQANHASKVLDVLDVYADGTIYEIAKRCGLDHVQVARTLAPLRRAQFIRAKIDQAGHEIERRGDTGRACSVWELTPQGKLAVRAA